MQTNILKGKEVTKEGGLPDDLNADEITFFKQKLAISCVFVFRIHFD